MALKGCCACVKYLVIVFNFLFWLAGIAVLSLGLWLYFNHSEYLQESDDNYMYFVPLYVLIAAGGVMTVLGFLGCCGALHESRTMLGLFFVILLIVFAAEIGCGVYAWQNKDSVKGSISNGFRGLMKRYNEENSRAHQVVDLIQHDFKCCGADSPSDWASNSILGALSVYSVPESCCASKDKEICESIRQIKITDSFSNVLSKEGCVTKLASMIEQHMNIFAAVGIGLGLMQILGLLFSIMLCCAIRTNGGRRYKV